MTSHRSRLVGARRLVLILTVVAAHLPTAAHACSACMGDPDSTHAAALNAAIFLMLGCIGGVLGLLTAFGIYLYRRARTPIPPHVQLAEMIGAQSK